MHVNVQMYVLPIVHLKMLIAGAEKVQLYVPVLSK